MRLLHLKSRNLVVPLVFILLLVLMGPSQAVTNLLDETEDTPVVEKPEIVQAPLLTLQEAIEASLESNRNLQMAQHAIEMARAGGQANLAGFHPDLDWTYSYQHNFLIDTIEIPDGGEYQSMDEEYAYTGVSFRYPIYQGGLRSATNRMIQADVEMAEYDRVVAEAMIAYAATDSFCAAREGFGGLAVRQASLDYLTELERQAQGFYDAGFMPLSDLLLVQVARAQAEVQVYEWTRHVRTRQSALAMVMGVDVSSEFTLVPIEFPIVEIPFSKETLTSWAIENRSELTRIQAERDKIEAQISMIRAGSGPNVDFSANYSIRGDSFAFSDSSDSLSGGISIWWDIYNFGRTSDLIAPLEAQLELLDIRAEEQKEQVKLDVELAMLSMESMYQNVQVTQFAVIQAEEALRVANRRLEEGLGLMLEVLNAQSTWTTIGAGSIYATHNYYRSMAALSGAVGIHPLDLIALLEAGGGIEQ